MQKHEFRIGIDAADGIQGKDMIRRFQNPTAGTLRLQMLEKAAMKAESIAMAVAVQPILIGGDAVGIVESQALENMGGDVGTFLRRIGKQRMMPANAGRQATEQAKLK